MQFGEALDVGFIQNCVIPWNWMSVWLALPIKPRINYDAFGYERGTVAFVQRRVVPALHLIAKYRRIPRQFTGVPARVRIHHQFVRIETMSLFGLVGTMDAIAVDLARTNISNPPMKEFVGVFRQFDALEFLFAFGVEQAEFNFCRIRREQ